MTGLIDIRVEDTLPEPALQFLKSCYRFVNDEWQHAYRVDLPDQGFERSLRSSCMSHLEGWEISPDREMSLGYGFETASGTLHEVDIVAKHPHVTAIAETKNRAGFLPDKNDVIVFFAKLLDYLAFNPILLMKEVCPVFISNSSFEESGLAACLGLGVHPVAPGLRPVAILVDSARRIRVELRRGAEVSKEIHGRFADFCAVLNRVSFALSTTWLTSRCGYVSENTIVLKAAGGLNTVALGHELRQLNAECTWLLGEVRRATS